MKTSAKKLVLSAILTAFTVISTMFIRIPLPLGYVNLGDVFVLLSAFLLSPLYAGLVAGVGSALADLLAFPLYAPGTFIIKGVMGVVACLVYKSLNKMFKCKLFAEIVAGIVATLIMAFGYFLYEILFFESVAVCIVNVPWNLLQGTVGAVLSVLILRVLKFTKVNR